MRGYIYKDILANFARMESRLTTGDDSDHEKFNFIKLIQTHPEIMFQIVDQADTTQENVGAHLVMLSKLRSTCKEANQWGGEVLLDPKLKSPAWLLRYNQKMLDATQNQMRPLNVVMPPALLMLKAYDMLKNMYTCEWIFGIVLHFMKSRCELVFEEVDAHFLFRNEESFEFVSYIYAGMRCHTSRIQILLDGFDILSQLVLVSRNQSIMAVQGLVLTCVDAVNAHMNNMDIVQAALELLDSVLSAAGVECETKLKACSLATFNCASAAISKMMVVFMKNMLLVVPGTRSDTKTRFFSVLSTASTLLINFWRYGTSEYLTGRACKKSVRRVGRLLYRYRHTTTFYGFFKNIVHVYERLQDTTQPGHSSMLHRLQKSKILQCCVQTLVECIDDTLDYTAIFLISHMARIGYKKIHSRPIENLVEFAIAKAATIIQMDIYSVLFVHHQLDISNAMNTLVTQGAPENFHTRQTACITRGVSIMIVSLLSRYAHEIHEKGAMSIHEETIVEGWIALLATLLRGNEEEQIRFIAVGGIQLCLKFFRDVIPGVHKSLMPFMCNLVTTHYALVGRGRMLNVVNEVSSAVIYTLEEDTEIGVFYGDCAISFLTFLLVDRQLAYDDSLRSIEVVKDMLAEIGSNPHSNEAGQLQYKILIFLVHLVESDPTYKHFQAEDYMGLVFPSNNDVVLREDYKSMVATVQSHMRR